VHKSMALLAAAPSAEEQLHYLLYLRQVKTGWTIDERQACLNWFRRDRSLDRHVGDTVKWFNEGGRSYGDGASYNNFMGHIRKDILASLNNNERAELASLIEAPKVVVKTPVNRHFVKEWTMSDLLPALEQAGGGRSFQNGRRAFED